jgi:regulator of RNase E activity RraA
MKALLSIFLGSLITVSFSTTHAATETALDSTSTSSEVVITNAPHTTAAYYNYNFGNKER